MRVLIQRVLSARVTVDGEVTGAIGPGILALIGIATADGPKEADYLADKLVNLRIFPDDQGRMNRSALETGAGLLLVSQFTLYGDCRKGRRPSFDLAAPPEHARELYNYFVARARQECPSVKTGVFQAHMSVQIENSGPVTLICDS